MYNSKLYYGNGVCGLESKDVDACVITVKYPVEIEDLSPYEFMLKIVGYKIIIIRFRKNKSSQLKELFNYQGNLKILKVIIVDQNKQTIDCSINKVMDYSELLGKSEDITTKSENLIAGYRFGKQVSKMKLINPIVPDLKSVKGQYYLIDGSEYDGMYHVHQDTGQRMSGSDHTEQSQNLYFKEELGGKTINKLILATLDNYKKTKKAKLIKTSANIRKRK